jgi:hypothetical protein
MIIPTLGTGQLYRVRRFRYQMLTAMERRRAMRLTCAIAACVTIAVLLWILR